MTKLEQAQALLTDLILEDVTRGAAAQGEDLIRDIFLSVQAAIMAPQSSPMIIPLKMAVLTDILPQLWNEATLLTLAKLAESRQ